MTDRQELIISLESLLIKADRGVSSLQMVNEDTIVIIFNNGVYKKVNIAGDSNLQIIKDLVEKIN